MYNLDLESSSEICTAYGEKPTYTLAIAWRAGPELCDENQDIVEKTTDKAAKALYECISTSLDIIKNNVDFIVFIERPNISYHGDNDVDSLLKGESSMVFSCRISTFPEIPKEILDKLNTTTE